MLTSAMPGVLPGGLDHGRRGLVRCRGPCRRRGCSWGGGRGSCGPTWWTRLFQLSECVWLSPRCRLGVFGGGWFAAAVVGGVGGPVAGGGVLPGDGDLDVDAEQPGEDGGGKFGGEAE